VRLLFWPYHHLISVICRKNVGAIAGGSIVGCTITIAAICVLLLWLRNRKKFRAENMVQVDLTAGMVSEQVQAVAQPTTAVTPMTELPNAGDSMQRSSDTILGQFLRSIYLRKFKATSPTSPLVPPSKLSMSMVASPTSLSSTSDIRRQPSDTNPVDQFLHRTSPSRDSSSMPPPFLPYIEQPVVQSSNTNTVDQLVHEESPSGDSSSMLPAPTSIPLVQTPVLPSTRQHLAQSDATSGAGLTSDQVRVIGSLYEQNLSPQTISSAISEMYQSAGGN
jgi:hypothetical protein